MLCDQCGFSQEMASQPRESIQELEGVLNFMNSSRVTATKTDANGNSYDLRLYQDILIKGISAVKADDENEAYFYLTRVLKAPDSSDKERVSAWIWLSAICEDNEEKRRCLLNALALEPTNAGARRGLAIVEGRLRSDDIIDPNRLPIRKQNQKPVAAVEHFRCPRCDGHMRYIPGDKELSCGYCHYRQPIAAGSPEDGSHPRDKIEQDFIAQLATARGHQQPLDTRTFQCPSCAVEFVIAPETLSITCAYCDNVYVLDGGAENQEIIPPHGIIPFAHTQEDADQALRNWFEKLNIHRPRVSPLVGEYVPVWSFDVSGDIRWSAMVPQGDQMTKRTGEDFALYVDYLVPASRKLSPNLSRHFESFNLENIVEYDSHYLSDWPAERYQIPLAEASLIARREIMEKLRGRRHRYIQHSHTNFRIGSSSGLNVTAYKLILLPVWIAHYWTNRDQPNATSHDVIIDGQNLVVYGDQPKGYMGALVNWLTGE
jgi:hypothetical protein